MSRHRGRAKAPRWVTRLRFACNVALYGSALLLAYVAWLQTQPVQVNWIVGHR